MERNIRFHSTGGAEVLMHGEIEPGGPGPGEVRIRQLFAGVNFVDIYHRTGLYPVPSLPATPGVEAVGTVEAVGAGVMDFKPGQRVAWAGLPMGGYAQVRLIPAERLLNVPGGIPDRLIAGALLRGLTAHMLLHEVTRTGPGSRILVTAAAGGLGTMLCRWARRLGAEVVGVVGSQAKAERALAAGANEVIVHSLEDLPTAVKAIAGGTGVDAVFDGVGGSTLLQCLDCVRPFGLVASLGQASGWLPEVPLAELGPRRSIAIARPSVFNYASDTRRYRAAAASFFEALQQGLAVDAGPDFPLAEARAAHMALEQGHTTGTVRLDLR